MESAMNRILLNHKPIDMPLEAALSAFAAQGMEHIAYLLQCTKKTVENHIRDGFDTEKDSSIAKAERYLVVAANTELCKEVDDQLSDIAKAIRIAMARQTNIEQVSDDINWLLSLIDTGKYDNDWAIPHLIGHSYHLLFMYWNWLHKKQKTNMPSHTVHYLKDAETFFSKSLSLSNDKAYFMVKSNLTAVHYLLDALIEESPRTGKLCCRSKPLLREASSTIYYNNFLESGLQLNNLEVLKNAIEQAALMEHKEYTKRALDNFVKVFDADANRDHGLALYKLNSIENSSFIKQFDQYKFFQGLVENESL